MRSVADCAGDLTESHAVSGFAEASDVALILGEPVGYLEAKGDGFGVNAVSAANLWRVLEFVCAHIQNFAKDHQVAFDDVGGVAHKKGLCGIDDIVGGHAIVQPARG